MIRLTVEDALAMARDAREQGYEELAQIFQNLATKFAAFNERSPLTLDEIYNRLGHDEFWRLIQGGNDDHRADAPGD
jgi:hypothetical protein